jgi:cytochrome P450
MLRFGFGHGPRVCPGKFLGQLEVALAVGAFVKMFKFQAESETNLPRAGVSTKPLDGTLVKVELRNA